MCPGEITSGRRAYYYYGEKGSIIRNAGGLFNYLDKVRDKEEEQRDKSLVEIFDFDGTGKYGCNHYYTPLEQIKKLGSKDKLLKGVDFSQLREITIHDGKITGFKLW